jgi:hypothetical protein
VIVGPSFHDDQLFDAIGFTIFSIGLVIVIVIVNAIISRVVPVSIDPFFFPDFHMIRCAAFSQDPVLVIAFRD